MSLRDEIHEQPQSLQRLLERGTAAVNRVAAEIRRREPRFIMLAARGSSDHAALYAQYLWAIRNRLPAALATPSTITLYGARPRLASAVVVGISQSGQSADIVAVLDEARRQGALAIAVTNEPASPLAGAADEVIELHTGPEEATAATKTYTAQLLTVAMLSVALDGGADERAALAGVPALVERALRADEAARELASGHVERHHAVVLGRGYEYATAREWALKLQELAHVFAVPFSAADFEHGPLALVEPGFSVLAIAPRGPSLRAVLPLLRRLRERHQARLVVLSDSAAARRLDEGLVIPGDVAEWLGPMVAIIPGQLYAYHLTRERGLDADRPRSISKVTITR